MIRLFSIVVPARIFTLFVSEIALLTACYIAAAFADPDITDVGLFLLDSGVARIAIPVAFVILGLFFRNLYAEVRIRTRLGLFQSLCLIFGAAFIGQGLIGYLDPARIIPRKVMLAGSVLGLLVLFGWRLLFDRAARSAVAAGRVLFIGMSAAAAEIATHFQAHPELGMSAIGYLESGSPVAGPAHVPRLGAMDNLDDVLDESMPESVVIGTRNDIRPWWADAFLALRFGGVEVQEASTLYERLFVRKCLTEMWPAKLVFGGAVEPPSLSVNLQAIYSWVVAFALAVLTLPFALTVAAIIRFSSHGPVLTRDTRVGLHDVPFGAYRFRCVAPDGAYTGVGRFLRRNGLVWLPQLLNVLKGDMAIVGPRPERPVFARRMNELIPVYRQRHRVKPGLTRWARIHRKPGDEQDSLRDLGYDLYYLENLSPLMDFLILLLSLRATESSADSAS